MPATLTILDSRGVPQDYAVSLTADFAPWHLGAFLLRRLDSGAIYRLTRAGTDWWICTCPQAQYNSDHRCKHIARMEEIMSEAESLNHETALAEREPEPESQREAALADVAQQTIDPDLSERHKVFWCNFPTTTPAGAALLLKCATPDHKADDKIGSEFDLWGVYAAPILLTKEETGEVIPCLRTVLILWGGKTIGFVSQGIADSLADLMAGHGKGPWNPPLRVKLRQLQLPNARRIYRLELLDDGAIDALFAVKEGGKATSGKRR